MIEPNRMPCACGGTIIVMAGDTVGQAVVRHQETIGHTAWRAQQEGTPPTRVQIVLGPAPCMVCREPVTWDGQAWRTEDGTDHGLIHEARRLGGRE
jgi:hypothetical protein